MHDWQRAHAELSRIAKQRAALDHEEGRWLLAAWRQQAHCRFGFGSFVEYVARLLGHSPRVTMEKLRVAEALEKLPALDKALRNNQVSWSAATVSRSTFPPTRSPPSAKPSPRCVATPEARWERSWRACSGEQAAAC